MGFFDILKSIFTPSISPRVRADLNQTDLVDIKKKWEEIETLIKLGKPSSFKTAILEADKLLDHVLKLYGYSGNSMGDRMKSIPRDNYSREFFDDMWGAHKLRNEMAHNIMYEVMNFEAKKAIGQYKNVLQILKVL